MHTSEILRNITGFNSKKSSFFQKINPYPQENQLYSGIRWLRDFSNVSLTFKNAYEFAMIKLA